MIVLPSGGEAAIRLSSIVCHRGYVGRESITGFACIQPATTQDAVAARLAQEIPLAPCAASPQAVPDNGPDTNI